MEIMEIKDLNFIARNTFPFNKLNAKGADKLLSLCLIKEYKEGEFIYKEGDHPDCFYLLLRGRVLALTTEEGKETEIELLKRGTCFGIISLLTDEPHSVTTKSIEESFVLKIEKEKFREFLKEYPLLSLDFSRLLSQRVKKRVKPKKVFQCKRIGIMGFSSSGKSTYMYNLALQLKEQTKKNIICIEISPQGTFSLPSLTKSQGQALKLDDFREESIDQHIIKGGVDCLLVKIDEKLNLSSLLNFLSESYHFIVYEVPFPLWDRYAKSPLSLDHYLHLLLYPNKDQLSKGAALIKSFKQKDPLYRERVKVIINEFPAKGESPFAQKRKILDHPIYATIPPYSDVSYQRALRRIAREIGEVVLGLALGSGAAYGLSHIGVLEVLRQNNIAIDMICGSSMGSIIAALWAVGYSTQEIKKKVEYFTRKISGFTFSNVFFPFKGILKARRIERICKDIFQDLTFYDVKHTLKVVAFDFIKRETKILDEGPLYKAVAASCAMPGIFEPIRFKKDILLDGGILNPLPTKILLRAGAHKIIAVNITPSREEMLKEYGKKDRLHVFDFIFGSIETMQQQFIQQALKICDVVIHPNLEGLGWMRFERIDEFIERGKTAAQENLDQIKNLAII